MQYWVNKVAIVTDCGDDVGVTIMEVLAKAGMTVIGFNKDKNVIDKTIKKLNDVINATIPGQFHMIICDITSSHEVESAIKKVNETYGGTDVLINNAFCNTDCLINMGSLEDFKRIIDVNIFAMVAFTRFVATSMIERETRGHIININDLCSCQLPLETKKTVFVATKAAVTSINEILRHEFRYLKANIKTTNIACGSIESDNAKLQSEPGLRIRDVAKLVKLILNTPEHLQVHEVLLDSVVE